jgi:hemoglobin-like flavoprotein
MLSFRGRLQTARHWLPGKGFRTYKPTRMTEKRLKLIRTSWKLLRQIDPQLLGGVFYDRLFTVQPSLRKLFSTSIDAQSVKLIHMLNAIIQHADRLEELAPELEAMALRHVAYGVKPEHYGAVGEALLWTLQQGLGPDWTGEMEEAWTACYTVLAETMIRSAEKVHP